jgi:hypothetical protein
MVFNVEKTITCEKFEEICSNLENQEVLLKREGVADIRIFKNNGMYNYQFKIKDKVIGDIVSKKDLGAMLIDID